MDQPETQQGRVMEIKLCGLTYGRISFALMFSSTSRILLVFNFLAGRHDVRFMCGSIEVTKMSSRKQVVAGERSSPPKEVVKWLF